MTVGASAFNSATSLPAAAGTRCCGGVRPAPDSAPQPLDRHRAREMAAGRADEGDALADRPRIHQPLKRPQRRPAPELERVVHRHRPGVLHEDPRLAAAARALPHRRSDRGTGLRCESGRQRKRRNASSRSAGSVTQSSKRRISSALCTIGSSSSRTRAGSRPRAARGRAPIRAPPTSAGRPGAAPRRPASASALACEATATSAATALVSQGSKGGSMARRRRAGHGGRTRRHCQEDSRGARRAGLSADRGEPAARCRRSC